MLCLHLFYSQVAKFHFLTGACVTGVGCACLNCLLEKRASRAAHSRLITHTHADTCMQTHPFCVTFLFEHVWCPVSGITRASLWPQAWGSDVTHCCPGRVAAWMGWQVCFHLFPDCCRAFSFWVRWPGLSSFSYRLCGWCRACHRRVLDWVNLIFFLVASECWCLTPLFLFGLLAACCAYTPAVLSGCLTIQHVSPCRSPLLVVMQLWQTRQGWQVRVWQEPLLFSMGAAGQRAAEPPWELVLGLGSGLLFPNSCPCSQRFSSRVRDLCWDLSCLFLNWRVRCHSSSDFWSEIPFNKCLPVHSPAAKTNMYCSIRTVLYFLQSYFLGC